MASPRARGAFFTPEAIARRLVAAALASRAFPTSVCDPAAGDGRLLRVVADALGGDAGRYGADLVGAPPSFDGSWAEADSLGLGLSAWPDAPTEGFDLVIGNPPFRNQLERETSLTAEERRAVSAELGAVAGGYADTAAMFLVRACEMAAPSGRVAFIMPLSYLAARDAAASRRRVLELATLEGVWVANERVFPDADVQVCALILDRGGHRRRAVRRWVGKEWTPIDPIEVDSDELAGGDTWSHLIAAALGVPDVRLDGSRRLGELVRATAGFRDQFYGLAPLVREAPDGGCPDDLAPLVTSGLIDPGRTAWGERTTRVARTTWRRPAIDVHDLDPHSPLGRWVSERLAPKLLVATQTRVVEAAPDPDGRAIPSTPVIAAHAEGDDLWRALAVLLSPPITAWALTHTGGSALSIDSVKLSARQVMALPLPLDPRSWESAAGFLAAAHRDGGIDRPTLLVAGRAMTTAYRCDDDVFAWWLARLPSEP